MSATVISVENVSKPYRLGTVSRKASRTVSRGTLAHDLNRARARGKPDPLAKIGEENRGNPRDGCLSRVTQPTEVVEGFRGAQFVTGETRDGC